MKKLQGKKQKNYETKNDCRIFFMSMQIFYSLLSTEEGIYQKKEHIIINLYACYFLMMI